MELRPTLAETLDQIVDYAVGRVHAHVRADYQSPWSRQEMLEQASATFEKLARPALASGDLGELVNAMFRTSDALFRALEADALDQTPASADNAGMTDASYPVSLVGEQHYQNAVEALRIGDRVTVLNEPDNPYDSEALVAIGPGGGAIGYVPRDSFLRRAVFEEGKGCRATVADLADDTQGKGFTHVVLTVTLTEQPIGERGYRPAED